MKTCLKCGPKPISDFGSDVRATDGLKSRCKACCAEQLHDWKEANQGRLQVARRVRYVVNAGDRCACCLATRYLSIDHINGDGARHRQDVIGNRRGGGESFHRWLIRNGFPPGYQTLCQPCNSSKGRGASCILDHAYTSREALVLTG
jgi:hypothetical protein